MTEKKEIYTLVWDIKKHAKDFGLDPFETIFEIVTFEEMNILASYGGFPCRYPHWNFGMEYEELEKSYTYGLHKIYEMVVNTDPCYAYLLECNNPIDQKIVIAHVFAHSDFFKNNGYFQHTNRKMLDEIANHGSRIRGYIEKHGEEEVGNFIDSSLSITSDLIDPESVFRKEQPKLEEELDEEDDVKRVGAVKEFPEYMREFINPEDFIEQQKKELEEKKKEKKKFPESPQKDTLLFLIENAPLKSWQRSILSMLREESYYYAPQAATKIINEGWAAYWHSKILTERCLTDSDLVDYADHHSGTLGGNRPGALNPYKLGIELFRDIEERWDKGRFGKEYNECEDFEKKKNWDKKLNLGRQKIFEVRKIYNDINFIDEFLTEELCERLKLFNYEYNPKMHTYEIADRDFKKVKMRLLLMLTNFGKPVIVLEDANYNNRSELYLRHGYEGRELRIDYVKDTLKNINALWQRPVHLETVVGGNKVLFSFDGKEHHESKFGEWMK